MPKSLNDYAIDGVEPELVVDIADGTFRFPKADTRISVGGWRVQCRSDHYPNAFQRWMLRLVFGIKVERI